MRAIQQIKPNYNFNQVSNFFILFAAAASIGGLIAFCVHYYCVGDNEKNDNISNDDLQDKTKTTDNPIPNKVIDFKCVIKQFKQENGIKSLRTEVFGISLDSTKQHKILQLRAKLYDIKAVRNHIVNIQLEKPQDVKQLTKGCRHEILPQRTMHLICTAARNESMFLA